MALVVTEKGAGDAKQAADDKRYGLEQHAMIADAMSRMGLTMPTADAGKLALILMQQIVDDPKTMSKEQLLENEKKRKQILARASALMTDKTLIPTAPMAELLGTASRVHVGGDDGAKTASLTVDAKAGVQITDIVSEPLAIDVQQRSQSLGVDNLSAEGKRRLAQEIQSVADDEEAMDAMRSHDGTKVAALTSDDAAKTTAAAAAVTSVPLVDAKTGQLSLVGALVDADELDDELD